MKDLTYQVSHFGISDVGLVREKNEDFWAECLESAFFVLADGMGGHKAGEIASKAAVNGLCAILKDALEASDTPTPQAASRTLKLSIQEVNRIIYRMSQQDHLLKGMGTTLVCLLFLPDHAIFAHVGDSRIYLIRNQRIKQMTDDHSLLRELIDMGQISQGQAAGFEYKNILTRAIGTEPTVEPTTNFAKIEMGDLYLLCSDGLSDHLHEADIEQILINNPNLDEAGKAMVKLAKQRGGHDNITLMLIQVDDEDLPR